MEKTFVAVDIETTGLSPDKDKIIEIGAVKVVDGVVIGEFSKLVNPFVELPERIIEITGITDEMLEGQQEIEAVMKEFLEFAKDVPLLGHNILFDYSFLKTAVMKLGCEFERNGIDTLAIARTIHPDLPSRSLESMCAYYGIINRNAHRAYDDAYAAMELYQHLNTLPNVELKIFDAKPLFYKPKKIEPMTLKQKNYLIDLIKYHKIKGRQSIDQMTKSEASRMIDSIILTYGKMK